MGPARGRVTQRGGLANVGRVKGTHSHERERGTEDFPFLSCFQIRKTTLKTNSETNSFSLRHPPLPQKISVTHTTSLRDAFPEELIKLSPSNLQKIEFRGSNKLTRFVVSPIQSCPKLKTVDLSRCASLKFVLLQSESLESLDLSKCSNLEKALVQCKKATSINLDGCENLKTLMIWSDTVAELVLSQCQKLTKLELYCPALLKENIKMPSVVPSPTKQSPKYVPVARLVLENMNARATVNRSLGGDEAALCGS